MYKILAALAWSAMVAAAGGFDDDDAVGNVEGTVEAEWFGFNGPEVLNSHNAGDNLLHCRQGGGHNPRGTWWPFWSLGPPRAGPIFFQRSRSCC